MYLNSWFPFLSLFSPSYPPPTVLLHGRVVPGGDNYRPFVAPASVRVDPLGRPYRCHVRPGSVGQPVNHRPQPIPSYHGSPLRGDRVRVGR